MYEKYQPAYHQPAYNDGGVNFPGTLKYENLDLILTFIILYIVFADKFLCLSFSLRFEMRVRRSKKHSVNRKSLHTMRCQSNHWKALYCETAFQLRGFAR